MSFAAASLLGALLLVSELCPVRGILETNGLKLQCTCLRRINKFISPTKYQKLEVSLPSSSCRTLEHHSQGREYSVCECPPPMGEENPPIPHQGEEPLTAFQRSGAGRGVPQSPEEAGATPQPPGLGLHPGLRPRTPALEGQERPGKTPALWKLSLLQLPPGLLFYGSAPVTEQGPDWTQGTSGVAKGGSKKVPNPHMKTNRKGQFNRMLFLATESDDKLNI
ncbi:uncharacterized protein LOC119939004 [Tachyglossus aculeatus]|uniref:uncharacterized protein LOC119939004 n=1 Tax=Tachyglossus aculeatus TaxID=9261 RepID=UPI0018F3BD6A|nr:uncharacterized protein LOC119939004 [Tachyglossus aculeatus]